jgi:hypothetical protein
MQDKYKKIIALLALLFVSGLVFHEFSASHLDDHSEFTCPARLLAASTVLIALATVVMPFNIPVPSGISKNHGLLGIRTYIDATHTRGPPTLQLT